MDRIDSLIDLLVKQRQQSESATTLLQTVGEIQATLLQAGAGQLQELGTAKIAVLMPAGSSSVTLKDEKNKKGEGVSINEAVSPAAPELANVLQSSPIHNLRRAIGINDRFLLIQELFQGDEKKYDEAIKSLESFTTFAEAAFYVEREIMAKANLSKENPAFVLLDQLLSRRFS